MHSFWTDMYQLSSWRRSILYPCLTLHSDHLKERSWKSWYPWGGAAAPHMFIRRQQTSSAVEIARDIMSTSVVCVCATCLRRSSCVLEREVAYAAAASVLTVHCAQCDVNNQKGNDGKAYRIVHFILYFYKSEVVVWMSVKLCPISVIMVERVRLFKATFLPSDGHVGLIFHKFNIKW